MQSTYELALLYHPDLELDLDKVNAKIEKLIAESGAKIKNRDVWGKRRLAYPIKGLEKAIYVFYTMELEGDKNVAKLEASLNICEEVIRQLITKLDLKAIELAKQMKADDDRGERSSSDDKKQQDNKAEDSKQSASGELKDV